MDNSYICVNFKRSPSLRLQKGQCRARRRPTRPCPAMPASVAEIQVLSLKMVAAIQVLSLKSVAEIQVPSLKRIEDEARDNTFLSVNAAT